MTREFITSGKGLGAIDDRVPAGEWVAQFVAEAEAPHERMMSVR